MKKKVISAFFGVYMTVCVVFAGARAVFFPAAAAEAEADTINIEAIAPDETEDVPPAETPIPVEQTPEPTPEPTPAAAVQYSGRHKGGRGRAASAEISGEPSEDVSWEPSEDVYRESSENAGAAPSPAAAASPSESVQPEEEEEEAEEEDADVPNDIPTLQDYLGKLRCGGCGRNCSLVRPHCMNGRRKASSYTDAYYAEYGESADEGVLSGFVFDDQV